MWIRNGFGQTVVGAIKGHQELIAKDAKRHEPLKCYPSPQRPQRDRAARCARIKQLANLISQGICATSNRVWALLSLWCVAASAEPQKRRRRNEKDAKSVQGRIADGIAGVGKSFPMVRQGRHWSVQDVREGIEAEGHWHDDLLGSRQIAAVTLLMSLGDLKTLAG
jgi:hypothetical protein